MRYLIFLLFVLFTMSLSAQRIPQVHTISEAGLEQISLANPYIGAVKLGYNLDEDAPLDDNLLFSATVQITPIQGDRFAIPIVGVAGLGSGDLLNPASGLNIGIYPYYIVSQSERFTLVAHGGLGYKVIAEGVGAGEDAPTQVKMMAGFEVMYGDPGELPITLSVTPGYMYHSADGIENTGVLEATAIFPIASGLGLLAEATSPFSDVFDGQFRFAALVTF